MNSTDVDQWCHRRRLIRERRRSLNNPMKFPIHNRWSGKIQFEAEIECDEAASIGVKAGLAFQWAYKTGAVMRGAVMRGAVMRDVDMRDVDMRDVDMRGADMRGADMRDVDMSGADMRGAVMRGAVMRDVDMRGADMRGADMRDVDMSGADMRGAVMSGADMRGVPSIPNIHQKVYAAASAENALEMSTWHTCETTHCRAGWVVQLAGDAGRALEFGVGTSSAAALIYLKSDPKLERIPDFHCKNAVALADMKRLAEAESVRVEP